MWDNAKHQNRLGREGIENSPEEKDLDTTQQCELAAQKANPALGCMKSSVGSRERSIFICSALIRLHLKYCIQLWHPQHRKDMD